jgi:deoxyribose-phosphate aldolase
MELTTSAIAGMIDLSCVRTYHTRQDIDELIQCAQRFSFGQVSVMHWIIPYVKEQLRNAPHIRVVGNVSFPSGSDTTSLKVAQAREMVKFGCDEIDMVMNIGALRSGLFQETSEDVRAVMETARNVPVKVIIEVMYLNKEQIHQACEICMKAGAAYVKTGSGWADKPTTVEDVKLVHSFVGDSIKIKASGGIRDLATLVEMYRAGARRFGVNQKSGRDIIEECLALGGTVQLHLE